MTELLELTAVELLAEYRSGTVSPVEVTEAVLARVRASEPTLQALYALDEAGALTAARAAQERWRSGTPAGALDGIPLTLKENIATAGTPVPLGTAALPLVPAAQDAPAAARVRAAGAVLFGKTTMPDFGMLTSSLSSFHPLTRNPWDLARTPGGSSAGAAAAAAAGYGPLHVGTDIGGSIRLPAAWCGLVGLKPSFGRVPVDPPYLGRVAGPLTRTVADTALLMEVLSAPDQRDYLSLPPAELDWRQLEGEVSGLRLGLWLDAGVGLPVEPEIAAAVSAAARLFEAAGASVEPVEPFLTRPMLDGVDGFWRTRFWSDFAQLPPERLAAVLPYIREWAEAGAELSGVEVYRGFAQIDAISATVNRLCASFDYVLSPVAPCSAFAAELPSPTNDPARPFEHIGFTVPFNMSGQPAAAINCGFTSSGQPIGLQLVGRRFDDLGVLRLARAFEQLRPADQGTRRPPPLPT